MRFGRRRTRKQLVISLLIVLNVVVILSIMLGTLDHNSIVIGSLTMSAVGLVGIWFFDSGSTWSWRSDAADYLTIGGMIGFWGTATDSVLSWVFAVIFYWGLATLVKRARAARMGSS